MGSHIHYVFCVVIQMFCWMFLLHALAYSLFTYHFCFVKVGPEDIEYRKHYQEDETELQFAVEEHMYPPAISLEVVHSEVPKHLRSCKRILLHVHGAKEGVMKFPIDVFVEKEGVP